MLGFISLLLSHAASETVAHNGAPRRRIRTVCATRAELRDKHGDSNSSWTRAYERYTLAQCTNSTCAGTWLCDLIQKIFHCVFHDNLVPLHAFVELLACEFCVGQSVGHVVNHGDDRVRNVELRCHGRF